jgi:small subunit ribosomal protein S2
MTTQELQGAMDEMFKAGAHFGYSKTRRHPSTGKFIFATKNKNDIIDLEKTETLLKDAEEFVKSLASTGKQILFVGVKPEAKKAVYDGALAIEMPYVTERWIGGAITNFSEIKKRVAKLEDLRDKKEKNMLDMYTKKERLLIDIDIMKMGRNFSGLVSMKKIPDALFVIDPKREHIAVDEARQAGIPVIALMNSDCNFKDVDYPIVANDASISSIAYFVNRIVEAYKQGRMQVAS